ncbi:hypothetical protein BBJ28_00024545 [Nothophytophthora sp. Chile5]|nr:hypothetical protein BBJ28_00024545 [Nothophytophthora sp. Chile5]
MRGSSSGSESVTDVATGDGGVSTSKTVVLCVLGGLGASVILALLLFLCRRRSREDLDPDTPLPQAEVAISFAVPSPPPDATVAQEMAAWKASGSSLASRNLPFTESTRAKLNGSARSSAEYDLSGRTSQLGDLSSRGPPPPQRDTAASSEQSFSIRGYSDFSAIRGGDSEASVVMHDRHSRSSLLSIDTGRSNSGWFQRQVPRSLDLHRFSSTSSTASSVVARKQHQNVASFISHDLTQPPSNRGAVTGGTGRSVDGKDWYSVIESPSDADRFSASSLDSDRLSDDRESFEL